MMAYSLIKRIPRASARRSVLTPFQSVQTAGNGRLPLFHHDEVDPAEWPGTGGRIISKWVAESIGIRSRGSGLSPEAVRAEVVVLLRSKDVPKADGLEVGR